MCEWFDQTCGELVEYIDGRGIGEDTLIIYVDGEHTGIGHRWHAGVRHHRDRLTPAQALAQLSQPLLLVAHEERSELGVDAESVEQLSGPARVLGEYHVDALQGATQARRLGVSRFGLQKLRVKFFSAVEIPRPVRGHCRAQQVCRF